MPVVRVTDLGGINTFVNPLLKKDGDMLRSVNVDSYPFGAVRKRAGYKTFLGTANGSAVTDLFSWTKNDGSLFVYRVSGGIIYHSIEGTGVWTISPNGTVTGQHVGHAVLDNTLILGDGAGSTRHTTNGTSFTNTTLAPVGEFFAQYQNRIYIAGTSSTLFYSTTGNAADWATSGTSDSSSLTIPGPGKLGQIFVAADRLNTTKTSGVMHRWDGFSLIDLATSKGPSSPYSVASSEGFFFYLNDEGINGYGGNRPELISNAVSAQMYNNAGSGVAGAVQGTAPGEVHFENYLAAIGTVTDDVVNETVNDAIIKYDFRRNDWRNWQFGDFPTTFHSFIDTNGDRQLIFGTDSGGQVMQLDGTKMEDNGSPIEVKMEFVISLDSPEFEKEWKTIWLYFNPGNQAKCQVALSNTFSRNALKWQEVGDASDGVARFRFEQGKSRGRLCFVRIYESSTTANFKFYGYSVDADGVPERK